MRTVAVMNEKGGSGKTTTTISLAAVLVVLIDCPPNLGLLSVNALAAADEVLVPVETHGIAAIGLSDLQRTVEDARGSQVNPALTIGAIVATRYNRTKEAKDCVDRCGTHFHTRCSKRWCAKALGSARPSRTRERSWSTTLTAWVPSTTELSLASSLSAGGCCLTRGKTKPRSKERTDAARQNGRGTSQPLRRGNAAFWKPGWRAGRAAH